MRGIVTFPGYRNANASYWMQVRGLVRKEITTSSCERAPTSQRTCSDISGKAGSAVSMALSEAFAQDVVPL